MIVPFRGDAEAAERLSRSLSALRVESGDELIVVDNSERDAFPETPGIRVVRATRERSSYYARNVGAAASSREGKKTWLLFTDADCVPVPWLIDAYFSRPVADDVGALAGAVLSDADQRHFLARYAADRGFLDQEAGVHTAEDAAATANLAIRKSAFDGIGGFTEGIRSGGDVDLCRRLMEAGWRIERRPEAVVTHLHRESLAELLRTIARYAAGARWLNARYPGSAPRWPLASGLVQCGKDIAANLVGRRFEEAAFRGVDALGMFAHTLGYRRSNSA